MNTTIMDAIGPGLCELMTIDEPGHNNLDIDDIAHELGVDVFDLAALLRGWVNHTTDEVETRHRQNLRRVLGCRHTLWQTSCEMCTPEQGDCTYCDCCPGNTCNPYNCQETEQHPRCECHNRT